jgi:hypothetical protein
LVPQAIIWVCRAVKRPAIEIVRGHNMTVFPPSLSVYDTCSLRCNAHLGWTSPSLALHLKVFLWNCWRSMVTVFATCRIWCAAARDDFMVPN